MGRPPKNPSDRKRYQLHVPLTDAQHALIQEAAKLEDQDKAEWARSVLLEAAKQQLAKGKSRQAR